MSDALNVPIRISVDAAQAEKGLQRVETAARDAAKGVPEAFRKSGAEMDKAGQQAASKYAGGLKSHLKTAMTGAAAYGLANFAKDSIAAASDLEETTSKVGVVFDETAAKMVEAFAKRGPEALGMSQQAAMDASATFGVFGKSAGLTSDALGTFSTDLTQLSVDLASFHNASPEETVEALGAALRGESEPMRRFGVLLDDATMREEALRQGLIATTKQALTPQQKVLAAQAIIMRQTSDAQGDFARTSDGMANSQRILAAKVEEAKAAIGKGLMPVASKLVDILSTSGVPIMESLGASVGTVAEASIPLIEVMGRVLELFAQLPGPVQTAVVAMAGLQKFGAFKPLVGGVSAFFGGIRDGARQAAAEVGKLDAPMSRATRTMGGLKSAGKGLYGAIGGPWGIALGAAAVGLGTWANYQQRAAESAARHAQAVATQTDILRENKGVLGEANYASFINEQRDLIELMERHGISTKAWGSALRGTEADRQAFLNDAMAMGDLDFMDRARIVTSFSVFDEQIDSARAQAEGLSGALDDVNMAAGEAAAAADRATPSHEQFSAAEEKVAMRAQDARVAVNDYTASAEDSMRAAANSAAANDQLAAAILNVANTSLAASDADIAWAQALADAGTKATELQGKVKLVNGEIDLSSKAGREAQTSLNGLASSARNVAQKHLEAGDAVGTVQSEMQSARGKYIAAAQALGISKTAAAKMADQAGLTRGDVWAMNEEFRKTPGSKNITISTNANSARQDVAGLDRTIRSLSGKTIVVQVHAQVSSELRRYGQGRLAIGGAVPAARKAAIGGLLQAIPWGGAIFGPGTKTSDSVRAILPSGPADLSTGEHVWTADEVERVGGHGVMYAWRDRVMGRRVPRRAGGGDLGRSYAIGGAASLTGEIQIGEILRWLAASLGSRADRVDNASDRLKELRKSAAEVNRELRIAERNAAKSKSKKDQSDYKRYLQEIAKLKSREEFHTKAITKAERDLASARKKAAVPVSDQFIRSAKRQNAIDRSFIKAAETLAARGAQDLAHQLLEDGSEEARRTAISLANGPLWKVNAAKNAARKSRDLDAKRDRLLERWDPEAKAEREKEAREKALQAKVDRALEVQNARIRNLDFARVGVRNVGSAAASVQSTHFHITAQSSQVQDVIDAGRFAVRQASLGSRIPVRGV